MSTTMAKSSLDAGALGSDEVDASALSSLPLSVRGLAYDVDGRRLLDGVDVDIAAGSLTVIMGPNGAGKSLLLRLLNGLLEPASGTISWAGVPQESADLSRQAMVFQRPVLLRRSAAENIEFVLRRTRDIEPLACDVVLRRVRLADRADTPARSLSGGEQQRLAIGRALATRPQVLLLDEPTSNLDPSATAMIEDIVREAHADGIKIIWITHDIGQARRLADDVVFLNKGRVTEHTPASQFFDGPTSTAARQYLAGEIVL